MKELLFKKKFIFFLLLLLNSQIYAQKAPEDFFKEDPIAFLSMDLDNSLIEFFMAGFWKSGISFGTGQAPETLLPDYISKPWLNNLDLYLNLSIDQSFIFSTHITDKIENSSFLLGYISPLPGLQKLYLGNSSIGLDKEYGLNKGVKAVEGIPGIAFHYRFEKSDLEALVRLKNSTSTTDSFSGGNLNFSSLNIGSFQLGNAFVLPHKNINNVHVFRKSKNGILFSDNQTYEELNLNEYTVNFSLGELFINKSYNDDLLVYYDIGTSPWDTINGSKLFYGIDAQGSLDTSATYSFDPIGTVFFNNISNKYANFYGRSSTGLSEISLAHSGKNYLKIHRRDEFSPFDNYSYYPTANNNELIASIISSDGSKISISLQKEGSFVRFLSGQNTDTNRQFPLLNLSLPQSQIKNMYGPKTENQNLPIVLLNSQITENRDLSLTSDPIPGSISVKRNGIIEPNWSYDAETKKLRLLSPILPEDTFDISYEKYDRLGLNQNLEALVGWNIADELTQYSTLLGFNASLNKYKSDELSTSVFDLNSSHIFSYKDDIQSLKNALNIGFKIPNSDNNSRISSMSETESSIVFTENIIGPAAPEAAYLHSNRGKHLYQNFLAVNGYIAYDSSSQPTTEAQSEGANTGPFLASGGQNDPDPNNVVIVKADATAGQWVGFGLKLSPENRALLSQAEYVRFWVRSKNFSVSEAKQLRIVSGAFQEDLDNNGINSSGILGKGLAFQQNGFTLYYNQSGSDDIILNGEDLNKNGISDQDNGLITLDDGSLFLNGNSDFKLLTIPLSNQMRRILYKTNILNFYITLPSTQTGTIIFGGLKLGGPSLIAKEANGTTLVSEITNTSAGISGNGNQSFTAGKNSPYEASNSFTKIKLSGNANDSIIKKTIPFNFYQAKLIHLILASDVSTSFNIIAKNQNGISFAINSISITPNKWLDLIVDPKNSNWQVLDSQNNIIDSGAVQIDFTQNIEQFEITILTTASGFLYLDDIIIEPQMPDFEIKNQTDYEISIKDLGLGIKITSYLQTRIPGVDYLNTEKFLSAQIVNSLSNDVLNLEIGFSFSTNFSYFYPQYFHSLSFPSPKISPLVLKDNFSFNPEKVNSSHENVLSIQENLISLGLITQRSKDSLTQNYSLQMKTPDTEIGTFQFSGKIGNSLKNELSSNSFLDYFIDQYQSIGFWDNIIIQNELLSGNYTFKNEAFEFFTDLNMSYNFTQDSEIQNNLRNYSIKIKPIFPDLNLDFLYTNISSFQANSDFYSPDIVKSNKILFESMFANPYISIPVYDIFDPTIYNLTYSGNAKMNSSLKTNLEMPKLNSELEFFLPKSLSFEILRERNQQNSLATTQLEAQLNLGFQAINQFGKLGIKPLFDFYTTDLFSNQISLYASDKVSGLFGLKMENYIKLFGLNNTLNWAEVATSVTNIRIIQDPWSLWIKNNLVIEQSQDTYLYDELEFSFSWAISELKNLDFRPDQFKNNPVFLYNLESLKLKYYPGTNPQKELFSSNFQIPGSWSVLENFSIELYHETSFFLPKLGYLMLYTKIGIGSLLEKSKIDALLGIELKVSL